MCHSLPTPHQHCGGFRTELGRGVRGRWELAAVPSCCWSEGGQVTDLPAGVTQETHNYMLVTATLDHFNHTAHVMSEMLPLGIKENKQDEVPLAAVVALSSDCRHLLVQWPSQPWLAYLWGKCDGGRRLSEQTHPRRP